MKRSAAENASPAAIRDAAERLHRRIYAADLSPSVAAAARTIADYGPYVDVPYDGSRIDTASWTLLELLQHHSLTYAERLVAGQALRVRDLIADARTGGAM
jgi:hypothetical protein